MTDGAAEPCPTTGDWLVVLARLEDDLRRTEQQLDSPELAAPSPWTPPADLGPMPRLLVERATDLLARQQTLRRALTRSLDELAAHRQFTDRVSATVTARHAAVYVDVTA